jgi:Flp pilus assembly protein TadD
VPAVTALALVLLGCNGTTASGGGMAAGHVTLRVADAALSANMPDVALRVAEGILEHAPQDTSALLTKGDAYYALGQPDRARAAYRAVLAIDPDSAAAQIGLGRTLVRNDPKAAEAAFAAAVRIEPTNTTALSNLGLARDLQGRHLEAQAAYRQALAVSPDMADVKVNMGLSLALSGKATEAVALLHPLDVGDASSRVWRDDLAAAMVMSGNRVEAQAVRRGVPRDEQQGSQLAALTTPAQVSAQVPPQTRSSPADLAPTETPAAAAVFLSSAPPQVKVSPLVKISNGTHVMPPADQPDPAVQQVATGEKIPSLDINRAPVVAVTQMTELSVPRVELPSLMAPAPRPAASARAPAPATQVPAPVSQAPTPAALAPTPIPDVLAAKPIVVVPAAAAGIPVPAPHASKSDTRAEKPATPSPKSSTPAAKRTAKTSRPAAVPNHPAPDHPAPNHLVPNQPAVALADTTNQSPPQSAARVDPAPRPASRGNASTGLFAQLGALDSQQRANAEWQRLRSCVPGLLDDRSAMVVEAEVGGRIYWRLRTSGFQSSADQIAFCAEMRAHGQNCW